MNRPSYSAARSLDHNVMQLSQLKLWLEYQFLEIHKKLDARQNEVKKKRRSQIFLLLLKGHSTCVL